MERVLDALLIVSVVLNILLVIDRVMLGKLLKKLNGLFNDFIASQESQIVKSEPTHMVNVPFEEAPDWIKDMLNTMHEQDVRFSPNKRRMLERRYVVSRLEYHDIDYNKGSDIKELITILNCFEDYEPGDWIKYYNKNEE